MPTVDPNDIKFDFAKSQALIDTINDCKKTFEELLDALAKEIDGDGAWWQGESYDAFRDVFYGKGCGKVTLDDAIQKAADLTSFLGRVMEAKQANEQWASSQF